MSRSRKKRPFAAHCGGSQKKDKRICNRVMRRTAKVSLRVHGEDAQYLSHDEAHNKWAMSQDGSRHYRPFSKVPGWMGWYEWFRWVLSK